MYTHQHKIIKMIKTILQASQKKFLPPFATSNIILVGDFNFYSNPKLDKLNVMSSKNDNPIYRSDIHSILDSMSLSDVFRILHTQTRRYTWHSRRKPSRLDYFFLSDHLLNELMFFKIIPVLHSDHSILNIKISNSHKNRGKGLWKFNTTLLHDEKYVNQIQTIISDSEIEYQNLKDKSLAWEMTKMKIRSYSVPYYVKKKKDKKIFKENLEKELNNL